MYKQTGYCPLCGAPILAQVSLHDGDTRSIYQPETELWEAVPAITYTCGCHRMYVERDEQRSGGNDFSSVIERIRTGKHVTRHLGS